MRLNGRVFGTNTVNRRSRLVEENNSDARTSRHYHRWLAVGQPVSLLTRQVSAQGCAPSTHVRLHG